MKSIKVLVKYPSEMTGEPVIYCLVKDYNITFNILQAHVNPGMRGELTMELTGSEQALEDSLKFLRLENLEVTVLTHSVVWDGDRCIHCGSCTAVCPSGALVLDADSKLMFDQEKCLICEQCITACPMGVMALDFSG